MKRFHFIFLTALLAFFTTNIAAQQMKIVRCTTPTIIIGGKKCARGNTFDKKEKISWVSSTQVLIAKDEKGRLVRFAATEEKKSGFSVSKAMNKKHQRMATRDFGNTGIDGTYIIDDKIVLPTPLDPNKKYTIEIRYTIDGETTVYKAKYLAKNATFTIKKDIFIKRLNHIKKAEIYACEEGKKDICLSRNIELLTIERAMQP